MRVLRSFLVFASVMLSFNAFANNCIVLNPNSNIELYTQSQNQSACISFKNVNIQKTYFVADPSLDKDAAYKIKIQSANGSVILDKTQSAAGVSTNAKLNTNYSSEILVTLTPMTQNIEYRYFVIHDENTTSGETSIYIGLASRKIISNIPPTKPCKGCYNSDSVGTLPLYMASSAGSMNEASQCTDANRPPEPAPRNRNTNEELNINAVLKVSRQWKNEINKTHTLGAQISAAFARMYVMHRGGGALDVAHDLSSKYGGSAEMGNFLYGANARAMGLPSSFIIRGSAGYQAISDSGWAGFPQGVYNFISNDGDNFGDSEQTMRGIRYYDEVHQNNQGDTSSTSCQDSQTLNGTNNTGAGGVGGGEGGGNGGGGVNTFPGGGAGWGGGGGGGGCAMWLVQKGYPPRCLSSK